MFDISQITPHFRCNAGTVQFGNNSPALVVGANQNRAILYLNGIGAANGWWLLADGDTGRSPPIWQFASGAPQRFTWSLDGPLSTFGWWAAPQGGLAVGNTKISYYEVIWWPNQ